MKDKTHLYYRQLVQENADHLLSRAESVQLSDHLAQCAGCRAYAADIAALEGNLRDTLNNRWEQNSDRMIQSIPQMTKVARRKVMFRKRISLISAAACLVLLAAAVIFVVNRLVPVPQRTQAAATQVALADATEEATPTQRPAAAQAALAIVSQSSYKDSNGNFHVVGELKNGGTKALTSLELTVTIQDASGKSLLKDSNKNVVDSLTFSPMLDTLAPDESSPFNYTSSNDAGTPDKWMVTVTGQQTADVTRPQYEVKNTQMKPNGSGGFFITGEIYNKSNTTEIVIHHLAGAVLDQGKKIIAANTSSDYALFLTTAGSSNGMDSTPFRIDVDNPGGSPDQYATYLDVEAAQPGAVTSYDTRLDITNHYFDENNEYHLVGTVTNNSQELLTTVLVGGLYDKDGMGLDAYAAKTDVNIAPGETIPFDLNGFSNVDSDSAEADRLDNYTVQLDPYNTFPSSFQSILLKTDGDKYEKNGDTWTFSGGVGNPTDKLLTDERVIVEVFDENNKLVAVGSDTLTSGGDSIIGDGLIFKNQFITYKVDIYLKPGVDSSKFTYKTLIKGYIK